MAQYQVSSSEVMVVFYGLHGNATQDKVKNRPQDEFENRPQEPQDKVKNRPQDTSRNKIRQDIERRIIEYCEIPRTKNEIAEYLNFSDIKGVTKRYLKPLLDRNEIAMTIPDKPNSKNQKYIAVNKIM